MEDKVEETETFDFPEEPIPDEEPTPDPEPEPEANTPEEDEA
jgi:hypothetical protein